MQTVTVMFVRCSLASTVVLVVDSDSSIGLSNLLQPSDSTKIVHIVADPRFVMANTWLQQREESSKRVMSPYEVQHTLPTCISGH